MPVPQATTSFLAYSEQKIDGCKQMPRLKQFIYCSLLVACCLILADCSDPDLICDDPLGCVRVEADDPIRLAYLLALSGEAGYVGQASLGGIEIALGEHNNQFMDHPIELIGQDTGCDLVQGMGAALEIADSPLIVSVLGPTCSPVAEEIIPIMREAGLVTISSSSSRATLPLVDHTTSGVWQQSFFRTVPNILWQGTVAAEFAMNGLGVTSAAVIYDEMAHSNTLQLAFAEAFTDLGGQVMFVQQMRVGQTDIADVVALINAEQPELLYLPLFEPEANLLSNTLAEEGQERLLLGADNLLLPSFAESAGTAVQGMAVTGPAASGAVYETLQAQWQLVYGDEPIVPYHAFAYDAANLLLMAMEAVVQEGGNGELLIGRQALRDALTEVSLAGASGQLRCEAGECNGVTAVGVYQLTEAQITEASWPPPLIWQPAEQ